MRKPWQCPRIPVYIPASEFATGNLEADGKQIIANCLEIQVKNHYTQAMSYDRDLRLRALEYAKEGHSLTQTASIFKVNISTIIAWKRRYEATGDVKIKVRCPVNKKIIPEKHDLFDNIEQVYEF